MRDHWLNDSQLSKKCQSQEREEKRKIEATILKGLSYHELSENPSSHFIFSPAQTNQLNAHFIKATQRPSPPLFLRSMRITNRALQLWQELCAFCKERWWTYHQRQKKKIYTEWKTEGTMGQAPKKGRGICSRKGNASPCTCYIFPFLRKWTKN